MSSEWLSNELTSLERRISILLSQYKMLREEHQGLNEKHQKLLEEVATYKQAIGALEEKTKFTQLAQHLQQLPTDTTEQNAVIQPTKIDHLGATQPSEQKQEAYLKLLNTYIDQLDQCIAYLEK